MQSGARLPKRPDHPSAIRGVRICACVFVMSGWLQQFACHLAHQWAVGSLVQVGPSRGVVALRRTHRSCIAAELSHRVGHPSVADSSPPSSSEPTAPENASGCCSPVTSDEARLWPNPGQKKTLHWSRGFAHPIKLRCGPSCEDAVAIRTDWSVSAPLWLSRCLDQFGTESQQRPRPLRDRCLRTTASRIVLSGLRFGEDPVSS